MCQYQLITRQPYLHDPTHILISSEWVCGNIPGSVENSYRSASPRPPTYEEDREHFVDYSSILCLRFEIQAMKTYNFFDWVSNTDSRNSQSFYLIWSKMLLQIVENIMNMFFTLWTSFFFHLSYFSDSSHKVLVYHNQTFSVLIITFTHVSYLIQYGLSMNMDL